jgi:hypothetical protein
MSTNNQVVQDSITKELCTLLMEPHLHQCLNFIVWQSCTRIHHLHIHILNENSGNLLWAHTYHYLGSEITSCTCTHEAAFCLLLPAKKHDNSTWLSTQFQWASLIAVHGLPLCCLSFQLAYQRFAQWTCPFQCLFNCKLIALMTEAV